MYGGILQAINKVDTDLKTQVGKMGAWRMHEVSKSDRCD